jgi:HTH-type transcriptional regulator/antitoxin HigA
MDAQFNNFAVPPGEFIREEIEARGWSQTDLAYILGMPVTAVNQIISGKRGISADMAKALGEAFGTSAELFANLQKAWELSRAKEPEPGVAKRGLVQGSYPLREMIRRGWLQDSGPDMLELQLTSFFDVLSFDQIPHLPHRAKRTNYPHYERIPAPQLAWLFRVRQIAKEMVVPAYSQAKLKRAIESMKAMRADPEEARHAPRLLQEAGVRLVAVESLPGGKIDGVCFWLKKSAPVIGISLRHDRIDNFWFVLRHECAHVLHEHGQSAEIVDVELDKASENESEEESVANFEAADFCVPQEQMDSFYLRKNPYFYEKDAVGFARRLGVHPGLVVGQIQRRTGNWSYLRRYQAKIRDIVLPSTIYDGWGHIAPAGLSEA